mgnify:FL=1
MSTIIHPLTDIYIPAEKFLACKREHLLDPSSKRTEHPIGDGAVSSRYYSNPKVHEARIGSTIIQRELTSFWHDLLSSRNMNREKVFEIMRDGRRFDASGMAKEGWKKIDDSLWIRGLSSRDKLMYIIKLKPYAKKEFNLVWSTHPRNGCPVIHHYITNVHY